MRSQEVRLRISINLHIECLECRLFEPSRETKNCYEKLGSLRNRGEIILFGWEKKTTSGGSKIQVINLSFRLRLMTPTSALIILDITKKLHPIIAHYCINIPASSRRLTRHQVLSYTSSKLGGRTKDTTKSLYNCIQCWDFRFFEPSRETRSGSSRNRG